mgnify:CR=1 FL=1
MITNTESLSYQDRDKNAYIYILDRANDFLKRDEVRVAGQAVDSLA